MKDLISTSDIESSTQTLQRLFDDDRLEGARSLEELRQRLTEVIVYMLLHQMEKLLGILYRIDVSEKKVKETFAQGNPSLIAPTLTDLIINREIQKIASRKKHR